MFYTIDIPNTLFSELNKNSQINQFFGKVYVGECMRLISDYYEIGSTHTQEGWQEYYKEIQGFEGLTIVFEELKSRLPNIEEQQIKKYIWHRVIGQTWNGYQKELIVVKELNAAFPDAHFKKTTFTIDHDYCIDAEMFYNKTLMLGLQIKPESYKAMGSPYQLRAKEAHRAKNERYKQEFAPYVYVYYGKDGIVDKEQLYNQIDLFLHYTNKGK